MIPQMTMLPDLTRSEDLLCVEPGYAVGNCFLVCMTHNDYRLKKTVVRRSKAEMNQHVAIHVVSETPPAN